MTMAASLTGSSKKERKLKDLKVLSKKIKTLKKPKKLLTSPTKKSKNIGQIAAQSKILDKTWRRAIKSLSSDSNLSPVHLEMLQKFEGHSVPQKKQKFFVKWVSTLLRLEKDKYRPVVEELYDLIKARSEEELAKLTAEKALGTEKKSRRQKLREKKLKKKLKKQLKGSDKDKIDAAMEEEKSKIEFVIPKANKRKHKKKHIREILKEKKERKAMEKTGAAAMEIASTSTIEPKHIKFGDYDVEESTEESMEISSNSTHKKQKKKKSLSA